MKEAGAELEDEYFKSLNPKRGEYIYADSAATDPKLSKKHLTHILWDFVQLLLSILLLIYEIRERVIVVICRVVLVR